MDKLSEYIEISSFNENTSLVQKGNTVYVKKRIPSELSYIYKILLDNCHKNISSIIEVFEFEDCAVVIEEYITGKVLADILANRKTFAEIEVKNIIGQICDGLLFLHRHNIIHRDINPNNIMLTNDGTVKIIDFDIARSAKQNAAADTQILGTVGYAAPEQFGFAQSTARADIYAVGVLANVMLTGQMPNVTLYSGRLGAVIKKAVAIDARTRYKSISEFKRAFTNEVDKSTPGFIRAVRHIPGFRTWKWWKMTVALLFYIIYIPLLTVFVELTCKECSNTFMTLFCEALIFAVPFLLITNTGGIWERLAPTRGKAFLYALLCSLISFTLGCCLFAPYLSEILY